MNMMTMEDAKIENMSDRNLAIYLRDYAKCRSGEIRALALAASNRILDLKKKAEEKQMTAHWIRLGPHHGMEQYKCSECCECCYTPGVMGEPDGITYRFCPICGADMRESEE